jgi:hypothetical protein
MANNLSSPRSDAAAWSLPCGGGPRQRTATRGSDAPPSWTKRATRCTGHGELIWRFLTMIREMQSLRPGARRCPMAFMVGSPPMLSLGRQFPTDPKVPSIHASRRCPRLCAPAGAMERLDFGIRRPPFLSFRPSPTPSYGDESF